MVQTFRLARMSPLILGLTLVALAVPVVFFVTVIAGGRLLLIPVLLVVAIYGWVWLRFRPTRFVVHPDVLEVTWPLKRRQLRREDISDVRLIDRRELRRDAGWCMRVGAGGLWGGFGWLWTQRRGIVQMYISRTDGFVWIERVGDRPWLITPEQPEAFVRALSPPGRPVGPHR
jgi:Bacterial PH domain